MTRFTVVWVRDAIDQLAEIWLAASDRDSVTDAANQIDRQLAEKPLVRGEHLSEGLRAYVIPPLRVLFSVYEPDCMVVAARVKPS